MIPIYQVDSFAEAPFKGNPAGVCLLEHELEPELYLKIAGEMNLSETAFIVPTGKSDTFKLRWFTPKSEVPLCGHATLATAWIQYTELGYSGELYYETLSGRLSVSRVHEKIKLIFPAELPNRLEVDELIEGAIGCGGKTYYGANTQKLLVEIEKPDLLYKLRPDSKTLATLAVGVPVKGLIVTTRSSGEYDFLSRYFAPWIGIEEDPVTGSAHTVLGPYWAKKLNKNFLRAYQASDRGGELQLEILQNNKVSILGSAVTMIRGHLNLQL